MTMTTTTTIGQKNSDTEAYHNFDEAIIQVYEQPYFPNNIISVSGRIVLVLQS